MKIGVVGSINMDFVVLAQRIPNKGETLMGKGLQYNAGGKGSNQAVSIAKLGGKVSMFGKVGSDENGRTLIQNMKSKGVNTDYIKVEEGMRTGLAIITVAEHDNTIVVVPGANEAVDIKYIQSIEKELLACKMIVLQHEIPFETNEYVAKLCKRNGIQILLNPAPAAKVGNQIMEYVDFITPNEHEAKILFGEENFESSLKKYPEKLIITRGEKGVAVAMEDGRIMEVKARKSSVVDTTGAGDTFNGAFVYAYTEGMELKKALKFANIAAGLSTEKQGAQNGMPDKDMVMKEMERE